MIRAMLGGSFDPVHRGHEALGAHLLAAGLAESVLVVPAGRSPHKDGYTAPAADRLALCRLAFAETPGVLVDDREIRRRGPSYTVETLEELTSEHPDHSWLLAIGEDNLTGFSRWRDPDRILRLARIAVFRRGDREPTVAACKRAGLPADRVVLVSDFDHPVSSTAVRAILAEGRVPDDLLSPTVADAIRSRHLYGI